MFIGFCDAESDFNLEVDSFIEFAQLHLVRYIVLLSLMCSKTEQSKLLTEAFWCIVFQILY